VSILKIMKLQIVSDTIIIAKNNFRLLNLPIYTFVEANIYKNYVQNYLADRKAPTFK
jgi:hypothetical protein